jgi:hypothetical protein
MRIKITDVKHPNLWYRDKIGQEYEVTDIGNGLYQRNNNHFYKLFKEDCELVEDEVQGTFNVATPDEVKEEDIDTLNEFSDIEDKSGEVDFE